MIIQKNDMEAANAIRKWGGTTKKLKNVAGTHRLQYFFNRPFSLTSPTYFCNACRNGYLYAIA
jgi:hypothetical protein